MGATLAALPHPLLMTLQLSAVQGAAVGAVAVAAAADPSAAVPDSMTQLERLLVRTRDFRECHIHASASRGRLSSVHTHAVQRL